MVPDNWETHPIGELCSSIVPGRNKPKKFDGDIPWITTPEIDGRYLPSRSQRHYISQETASEAGAKVVPPGAVVITAVGELGLVAITTKPTILNQQLHAFVCPQHIHNEYLAYWLDTQRSYMDKVASKTTIPYMNKTNCESIPVCYPPIDQQKKIAKILSAWDRAITATERLLATSQQQKQALMQQLLTRKKRIAGFIEDWKNRPLGQLFNERNETNRPDLPLLSITTEQGVIDRADSGKKDTSSEDKSKYRRICPGDIGYNTMRMWQGVSGLSDKEGIVSPAYTILQTTALADSKFASYLFKTPTLIHVFMRHSQGLVSDTWNLKYEHFAKIKVFAPCVAEQQKIAQVLSTADAEITNLQAQLATLRLEKKALMQQLLTGQRRVRLDDEAAA